MKAKHLGASRTGHQGNDEQYGVLLTQDEVAARLKVTVRTVVRLQHDGVLPFIALGKAIRFFWPAVISHLTTHFTVVRSLRSATTPPATIHSTTAPAGNKGGRP